MAETRSDFFEEIASGRWFLKVFYLLLSFPLGIFYFVFLVAGFSVGFSLLILWIGIPILLGMLAAWWGLAIFERHLAMTMLGVAIPPMAREEVRDAGLGARLLAHLKNPVTWKSLAYLFLRFPFGIVSFVATVTLLSVSLALLATPFLYDMLPYYIFAPFWRVGTIQEALICSALGLLIAAMTVPALSGLAGLWGRFARLMLGNERAVTAPVTPPPGRPVTIP